MQIGDKVKVSNSVHRYNGQTGEIVDIKNGDGSNWYVVKFGDGETSDFRARYLTKVE